METRRIEKIEVKLTPAEKDRIGNDSLLSNAPSLSAYVRARLLNEAPKSHNEILSPTQPPELERNAEANMGSVSGTETRKPSDPPRR